MYYFLQETSFTQATGMRDHSDFAERKLDFGSIILLESTTRNCLTYVLLCNILPVFSYCISSQKSEMLSDCDRQCL